MRVGSEPESPWVTSPRIGNINGHVHQHPWSGVVFQYNLVDNPGPGFPELDPVLLGRTLQEVKDLFVGSDRALYNG